MKKKNSVDTFHDHALKAKAKSNFREKIFDTKRQKKLKKCILHFVETRDNFLHLLKPSKFAMFRTMKKILNFISF